jgi:oxygen-independent coproporphyrinogen-3 oxidase
VASILDHVRSHFGLADEAEITLEANPSSVEAGKFEALRAAGINRLSLGVQALDDRDLRMLGRAHTASEALAAIKLTEAVFPRMSFDMIYGRHGQDLSEWRDELKRVLDLSAGHLSLYQLTIEAGTKYNTLFERGELNLPDNERAARFFHATRTLCDKAGLPSYEISNYAAKGQKSRHNLAYWRYSSYLGVGPGAHGRVVRAGERYASAMLRSPKRWLKQVRTRGHGLDSLDKLTGAEQADEMLLMGMRLVEGVDLALMENVTGHVIKADKLSGLVADGLCERSQDGRFIRASDRGFGVLNRIVERLSLALEPTPAQRHLVDK